MQPQPTRVMGADDPLERLADEVVQAVEGIRGHGAPMPRSENSHPLDEGYCEYAYVPMPLMIEPA